ncbi:MAG: hypothetical protein KGJ66_09455 [Alphaproteobacteria bacterium]|nr:hypothetical protein [Alphaproteobacteria bacterium]
MERSARFALKSYDILHGPQGGSIASAAFLTKSWCCGGALAYQYLLVPLAVWATSWSGYFFPRPPALDDTLWQLMFGMLGMGGLRTYEKLKGVAGVH